MIRHRTFKPNPSDLLLAAILTSPVASHSLAELVVRTSFSLGTVTRTAIEARGWLQADSRGRYQIAPLGLLWSAERSEIRDAEMAVAG